MSFNPEDKFPKEGIPVYNSNGEQYDLTDQRYQYHDGLDNTTKVKDSSVNNLFSTPGAAQARAKQIGCGGYHQVTVDGKTYYKPCDDPSYYTLRMEQLESALGFTYIGNYRVLSWDNPFLYVNKFNGWIINASNSGNNGPTLDAQDIAIDFRYSIDGVTWSLWTNVGTALGGIVNEFSDIFSITLDPKNKFYPEFRFTSVLLNNDGTIIYNTNEPIEPSIVITEFDLDLIYSAPDEKVITRPSRICSNEYSNRPVIFSDRKSTFNPYAVNKALNLYQDLSQMVNKVFGLDANYYSIQPQARGKDVVLREYTLFNVVSEKCLKIMVNQNQFPDNRINFDPFGLQFDSNPFEIHIDKRYFESVFGKGSQPRRRDIIYFPITNRIYEINSTYLFRDFLNAPVYFKIELQKYSPRSNTFFQDPAYKEELDGIALTTTELFGDEIKSEELKYSKPQQYATTITQMSQDPIRSYVYKDLSIIEHDLNNNWTIVFNHYYDLSGSFNDVSEFTYDPNRYKNAIRYKSLPKLGNSDELSYTCWFSLRDFYDNTKMTARGYPILNLTLESYDANFLRFSTYPNRHRLEEWKSYASNPEGYVAIQGDKLHSGGYEVLKVVDEYRFNVKNNSMTFSAGTIIWKMQKAQNRNLISGLYEDGNNIKGLRIDLVHSGVMDENTNPFLGQGSLIIRINDKIINSPLQFLPEYGDWYGVVVNVSNIYKQIAANIWELTYDPVNPNEQASKLRKVHEEVRMITQPITFEAPSSINTDKSSPFYGTDDNSYKIFTGPVWLSNIRLFKRMIDVDTQSTVLNQNIVRDAQLAHIIDNAKPLLNVPKFARNR